MTAGTQALVCPHCGSSNMEEPTRNRYGVMGTMCHDCGADMTTKAATPGTREHELFWNLRNEAFRMAGYTGVSNNEAGKRCCGGLEDLPAGTVAWQDSDGWLWCRMHLDARLREST